MSRFRDHDSRPRHADTQDALLAMIHRFDEIAEAGGYEHLRDAGAAPIRLEAINTLASARRELERCTFNPDDLIKHAHSIAEFRMSSHGNLLMWINDLSIELKLMHGLVPHRAADITSQQLERGRKLINELDECRQQLRFER